MLIGGHWVALFLAAFCGLFLVVISYTWVGVSNVWSLSQTLLEVAKDGNLQSLPICSSQGPSRFQQVCKDSYGQVHTFQSAQAEQSFPDREGVPARDLPSATPIVQTVYVTMPPQLARITQDQAPPLPEMTTQTTQQTTVQTTLLTVVSQPSSSSSGTSTTATSDSSSSATSSTSTETSTSATDKSDSSATTSTSNNESSTTTTSSATTTTTSGGGVVIETKKAVVWQDPDGSNPSTSAVPDATSTGAPS